MGSYIESIESGRLPVSEREALSKEQRIIEAIYLGLRMTAGIDLAGFRAKFGIDFIRAFKEVITDLTERNYIAVKNNRCALTRRGRAYLDSIASMFVTRDVSET